MKLKAVMFATLVAVGTVSAQAGQFQTLPTNLTSLTPANGGLVSGANSLSGDKLYIEMTSASYLTGYDHIVDTPATPGANAGDVVATSLSYRAFTGATTNYTGTLTLLDWRVTRGVALTDQDDTYFDESGNDLADVAQADVFDFVYQDSYDGSLVFGMRFLNREDNNQEANYLYRDNFDGYSAAAAWTFSTDYDLRMYQAGRTASPTHATPVPFDAGSIRFKSDVSVSEGNPWSGLFLVKTNATAYGLVNSSLGWAQAGEEGQSVVRNSILGFAPVPEPETYGMLLAGLGLLGFTARRKSQV